MSCDTFHDSSFDLDVSIGALSRSILSTHLSTAATIGDTVAAAVIAVAASIATLFTTFCHLVSGKVISVAIGLDRDVRALMILADEQKI